jgi:hypothetical protein
MGSFLSPLLPKGRAYCCEELMEELGYKGADPAIGTAL